MTGEVTLRGRVLPIGGLKEKALAAKRMGIKTVIIPNRNKKDLIEMPKYVKEGMNFVIVETMDDVLKTALGSGKTSKAVKARGKAKIKINTKTIKATSVKKTTDNKPSNKKTSKVKNATPRNRRATTSKGNKKKV